MEQMSKAESNQQSKSIFIYEYLSGGGICNEDVPMSLLSEGFSMLSALIEDFSSIGFKIHLLLDSRLLDKLKLIKQKSKWIKYDLIKDPKELKSRFDEYVIISDYILVIAPESNFILFKLVSRVEEILKAFDNKTILNVCSALTFIGSNKLVTEEKLKDVLGLNFPSSFNMSSFLDYYENIVKDPEKIVSPSKVAQFIIKPSDGVGCVETYQISFDSNYFSTYPAKILEDLRDIFNYIKKTSPQSDYIVQNKIDGIPLSLSAINRNGTLSFLSINKQNLVAEIIPISKTLNNCILEKLNYIGGITPYYEISDDLSLYLASMVRNLCQRYIFTGFFGIDFIYNSNYKIIDNPKKALTLIELNPRITTPYIAYSLLLRQESKNIAEFFFKGDFIYQSQTIQNICEYFKDEQNNEMKIILKSRK